MVCRRYPAQRCARPQGRHVQIRQREENRRIAQGFGRTQSTAQSRSLPVGDVDAQFLYQPCRQEPDGASTSYAGAGEGRAAATIQARGVVPSAVLTRMRLLEGPLFA